MPNVMAALPNMVAPAVQRRKVWLTPTTGVPCSNVAKTRNPLKFAGVPQTPESISAVTPVSGPKFTILLGHLGEILLLKKFFFRLSICALVAKITRQSCAMPRWRVFCVLYFQRAARITFETCILNSHYGHTMCKSIIIIRKFITRTCSQALSMNRRRGQSLDGLTVCINC